MEEKRRFSSTEANFRNVPKIEIIPTLNCYCKQISDVNFYIESRIQNSWEILHDHMLRLRKIIPVAPSIILVEQSKVQVSPSNFIHVDLKYLYRSLRRTCSPTTSKLWITLLVIITQRKRNFSFTYILPYVTTLSWWKHKFNSQNSPRDTFTYKPWKLQNT